MQYFVVEEIFVAEDPAIGGRSWQTGLLAFFEGLVNETPGVLKRPHLALRGRPGELAIVRFEPSVGGLFVAATGGTDSGTLPTESLTVSGFYPTHAHGAIVQLARYRRPDVVLWMDESARLQLIAGPNEQLRVGHQGLPDSLAGLDRSLERFQAAAKSRASLVGV